MALSWLKRLPVAVAGMRPVLSRDEMASAFAGQLGGGSGFW